MIGFLRKNSLYLSLMIALSAMLGSLYASEILHLEPCSLCWYQRILMYPLTLILTIGILRRDKAMHQYVLPFSLFGGAIALYHYLLYIGVITTHIVPCGIGVSCTQRLPELFGFANVIFLSLLSFVSITILMLIHRTRHENE